MRWRRVWPGAGCIGMRASGGRGTPVQRTPLQGSGDGRLVEQWQHGATEAPPSLSSFSPGELRVLGGEDARVRFACILVPADGL